MAHSDMHVEGYDIGPQDYFVRGDNRLADAVVHNERQLLFYAAFEFRCAIEQVLKLYLELLKPNSWGKKLKKLYRAKDLQREILDFEPEFHEKLRFVDILVRSLGKKGVYMIDLGEMNTHYGKIGNYMHAQINPETTVLNEQWWKHFFGVLTEAGSYLKSVLSHDLATITMSDKGWDLYEKWESGEYTEKDVQQEFLQDLIDPDSV